MLDGGDASTSAVVVDHGIEYAAKPPYKLVRQYVMGDVLGEGSQAKVREALDSKTLRRVAIKIINIKQLRKIRNAEAGLKRELSIHRRLKHPHVVEMIECFTIEKAEKQKEKCYVVLEHVPGGSVQDLLDGAPDGVLPLEWRGAFYASFWRASNIATRRASSTATLSRRIYWWPPTACCV